MEKKHMKTKAKKEAIKSLREIMGKMGGQGLSDHLKKESSHEDSDHKEGAVDEKKHGGIVAQVTAKDPESLEEGLKKAASMVGEAGEEGMDEDYESTSHYDEMSKEELIELLKSR